LPHPKVPVLGTSQHAQGMAPVSLIPKGGATAPKPEPEDGAKAGRKGKKEDAEAVEVYRWCPGPFFWSRVTLPK